MRTYPSLVGQRFGMLVVVEQTESSQSGHRRWICQCDCGNKCVVSSANLNRGHTVSCGCIKYKDLAGQHIGTLTVIERSDKYADRGKRKVQLWKCRCDCGAITYKPTDSLTNSDISMCRECAAKYATSKARENAGFVEGTQLSKITNLAPSAANTSGVRGVYYEKKTGKWRAQIKFMNKRHYLGTYNTIEEAAQARRRGEEEYFGTFLDTFGE